MLETLPSGELVARARAGDEAAWAALTERYTGLLWAIVQAYGAPDPADVVQLTWLRLVEHIDALRDPARVGGWLAVTARREAVRAARRRERPARERPLAAVPDPAAQPDQVCADRDRLRTVLAAIGALPELCRQVLRIFALSPSYAEVAAALDIPLGSVGPTRTRCLTALRARLGELPDGGAR